MTLDAHQLKREARAATGLADFGSGPLDEGLEIFCNSLNIDGKLSETGQRQAAGQIRRNLIQRLIQVGIRASNTEQQEQIERFGIETISATECQLIGNIELDLTGPVYISFDLDVLDPAFAPGVSHPEHGGISTRDAITLIQSLSGPIIGADIVELNPKRDPTGLTAGVAAKILKELASRMLEA